jgi:DtxR family manganese transport transcriptional regulator
VAHTDASRFEKVRNDHRTETAEDYIEAIADIVHARGECRVRDLAELMGVSHVTVSRIVTRLEDEGLVDRQPYHPIRLTAAGEHMAAESRRRHRVVHEFLRAIGVPEADARRDAEGIEHHVGETTLQAMQRIIDQHEASAHD